MELMQLEMFVAVVEERSVGRAAQRVFRTQPAVSIALGKLASEIGTPLLDGPRGGQRHLTRAGDVLYEYASQILGMRDEALWLLQGERRSCTPRLGVGVDRDENAQWISQLTVRFKEKQPNVRVKTLFGSQDKLSIALRGRVIDFALLSTRPKSQGRNADLVSARIARFERGQSLWLVQRRVGNSNIAKDFEALLTSTSTSSPHRTDPLHPNRRKHAPELTVV